MFEMTQILVPKEKYKFNIHNYLIFVLNNIIYTIFSYKVMVSISSIRTIYICWSTLTMSCKRTMNICKGTLYAVNYQTERLALVIIYQQW